MDIKAKKSKVAFTTIINAVVLIYAIVIGFVNFSFFQNEPSGVFSNVVHIANASSLISLFFLVVMEIASTFFDKNATWYTAFIAITIFFTAAFSSDSNLMMESIGMTLSKEYIRYISPILSYVFFIFSLVFFLLFFMHDYPVNFLKMEQVASISILILSGIAFIVLIFFGYAFFAIIPVVLVAIYWFIRFIINVYRNNGLSNTFFYSSIIFSLVVSFSLSEAISISNDYAYNGFGITSFYCLAIIILFFLIYIDFVLKVTKKADESTVYEKRLNELQTSILKNQINPHFIFNALNVIQSQYLISTSKGDAAMGIFSKHLRAYVEAGDEFLVPLQKEIDNVNSYLEILNMSIDDKLEILYDIESFDFEVPYFSLQPIIENAFKYSQVQAKEDGYIRIESFEDENFYHIIVEDNGVGFDTNNIKKTSTGIKNSRDRFKLLLNASLIIESKIGEGTKVIIDIPKKK